MGFLFPDKLLDRISSLKTPVAERIFELMLLLVLIWGAGYVSEHGPELVRHVGFMVVTVGYVVGFVMMISLFITIFKSMGIAPNKSQRENQRQ